MDSTDGQTDGAVDDTGF